jgi:hypothetical protein
MPMNGEELQHLLSVQHDAASLHQAILHGLLHSGWGRQSLLLSADQHAMLAGLLVRWVAQATVDTEEQAIDLLQARSGLRRLVEASGLDMASLLSQALLPGSGCSLATLTQNSRYKLALLADASLLSPAALLEWSRQEPVLAMLFAIQALDVQTVESPAWVAVNRLIETLPDLPLADLPLSVLNPLQQACFRLSYLGSPQRYRAKQKLVEQSRHVLALHDRLQTQCPPPPSRPRPLLLVVGEGLRDGHALFRFFAEPIRDLRAHFHVVLLSDHSVNSGTASELADDVMYFASSTDPVQAWCRQIGDLAPDIIFYPGIGMSFATFTLSQQRLAPLQIASIGCPASSCSPVIDGTLLFEGLQAPAGLPVAIRYDRHRLRPARPGMQPEPVQMSRAEQACPCIGINAMAIKLNDDFLSTVETIVQRYQQPCRLRFMPNVEGVELQALMRMLLSRFPGAEVLPSMGHQQYMSELAQCDLVLQSFPYGGANTTTDALNLQIPVVALGSEWLSGQTDWLLLHDRGVSGLWARSREEYVELAMKLLQNGTFASEVRQQLQQAQQPDARRLQGNVSAGDALWAFWQQQVGEVT